MATVKISCNGCIHLQACTDTAERVLRLEEARAKQNGEDRQLKYDCYGYEKYCKNYARYFENYD